MFCYEQTLHGHWAIFLHRAAGPGEEATRHPELGGSASDSGGRKATALSRLPFKHRRTKLVERGAMPRSPATNCRRRILLFRQEKPRTTDFLF
jgi:hypothetical protein